MAPRRPTGAATFTVGDHEVELSWRDTVLSPFVDKGDAFAALATPAGELVVFLFHAAGPDLRNADAAASSAVDILRGNWADLSVTRRADREVAGLAGRDVRVVVDETLSARIVVAPLGRNAFLEVRFLHDGPPEDWTGFTDTLLDTIVVNDAGLTGLLPTAEAESEEVVVSASERALLDAGARIGRIGNPSTASWSDDGLLVVNGSGASLLGPGADEPDTLWTSEGWNPRGPGGALSGGRLFVLDPEDGGAVLAVRDGVAEPAGFRADVIAPAPGDGLLLLRTPPLVALPGAADWLLRASPLQLVHRTGDGRERVLAEFDGRAGTAVAADGAETRALVVSTSSVTREALGRGDADEARLSVVPLSGRGRTRELGVWRQVRLVTPAEGGWLVTGAPGDAPRGIHHLTPDGERTLLVSGAAPLGLRFADGALVFASNRAVPEDERYAWHAVYRVPEADARRLGPRAWPFDPGTLDRIARAALEELGNPTKAEVLATRADVAAFAEAAREQARALVGTPLPADPEGIDDLMTYGDGRTHGDAEVLLLTALVADGLLREGARWVEGAPPGAEALVPWRMPDRSNAFALAHDPYGLVMSTLFDSDGYWRPVRSALREADGRVLLLGADVDALEREADALLDRSFADVLLEPGRVDELLAVLTEHADNGNLRALAYQELHVQGRVDDLARVAGAFAERPDATIADLRHALGARLLAASSRADHARVAQRALAALGEHPDDATLLLVLGLAFEGSDDADAASKARAAFARALETSPWGDVAEAAQEGLDRLGG